MITCPSNVDKYFYVTIFQRNLYTIKLLLITPQRKLFSVSVTFVWWQNQVICYSTPQFSSNTFLNKLMFRIFCVTNFGHITRVVDTVDGADISKPLPGYNTKTGSFIPHSKRNHLFLIFMVTPCISNIKYFIVQLMHWII